jgi:hypothetical protein
MTNIDTALHQLREERKQAQTQIAKLDQAIAAVEGVLKAGGNSQITTRTSRSNSRGRSLSAAARKRISESQRARWAQRRKQATTSSAGKARPAARKTMSPAARRRIAAAQKARWARFRAKQQKAAA